MPTPGPWEGPVQMSSVPGAVQSGGYFRWGRYAPQDVLPGVHSDAEVDAIINGLRAATNGGIEEVGPGTPGEPLGSRCSARCVYDLPTDGTFRDNGDARDHGWFLECNLSAGWADFITYVQTQQATAGAADYEIEGGPSLHIISVDAAQVMIPMDLTADGENVSIEVDITTAPGADMDTMGAPHVWEHRVLTAGYPPDSSGGLNSEDPINLALAPGQFEDTVGGFHLYSQSTQGVGSWDAPGYAFGDETGCSIWFHSSSVGVYEITYDVTYPRYRLLFDGVLPPVPVVAESVTRQFPRDDALGLGSAPRIFPPPRRGRVVGGYQ